VKNGSLIRNMSNVELVWIQQTLRALSATLTQRGASTRLTLNRLKESEFYMRVYE